MNQETTVDTTAEDDQTIGKPFTLQQREYIQVKLGYSFAKNLYNKLNNMQYILGIDEVGRGCLAGPVYMASVLLNANYPKFTNHTGKSDYTNFKELAFIRDSKKLSLLKRQTILDFVIEKRIEYQLIHASNSLIDIYGIGICLSHIILIIISLCNKNLDCQIIIDGQITLLKEPNKDLFYAILRENNIKSIKIVDLNVLNILRENKADDNRSEERRVGKEC